MTYLGFPNCLSNILYNLIKDHSCLWLSCVLVPFNLDFRTVLLIYYVFLLFIVDTFERARLLIYFLELDLSDCSLIIRFRLYVFDKNSNYIDDTLMKGLDWEREKSTSHGMKVHGMWTMACMWCRQFYNFTGCWNFPQLCFSLFWHYLIQVPPPNA